MFSWMLIIIMTKYAIPLDAFQLEMLMKYKLQNPIRNLGNEQNFIECANGKKSIPTTYENNTMWDSYFSAQYMGARLLRMDCSDSRFPRCSPITLPYINIPVEDTFSQKQRDINNNYIFYNPSIVEITEKMRETLKIGKYIAVSRTGGEYGCLVSVKRYCRVPHYHRQAVLVQVLDHNFLPISQSFIQVCFNDSDVLREVGGDGYYKSTSVSVHGFYAFMGNKPSYNSCGLIVGIDPRIFVIGHDLWLMTFCGSIGACRGDRDMYRGILKVVNYGNDILAYMATESKVSLPSRGRNYCFFQSQNVNYLMTSVMPLRIYDLNYTIHDARKKEEFVIFNGVEWHLHGGALTFWNTTKHEGFLGIAHSFKYSGKHKTSPNNRSEIFNRLYVSAFFLLDKTSPFKLLRFSDKFCFESVGYSEECEAIQFISSILMVAGSNGTRRLIIGYGVNDCESRVWSASTEQVDEMLEVAVVTNR